VSQLLYLDCLNICACKKSALCSLLVASIYVAKDGSIAAVFRVCHTLGSDEFITAFSSDDAL
jgi:hypothetical protein